MNVGYNAHPRQKLPHVLLEMQTIRVCKKTQSFSAYLQCPGVKKYGWPCES